MRSICLCTTVLLHLALAIPPVTAQSGGIPRDEVRRATPESRRHDFLHALDGMQRKFFRDDDAFLAKSATHIHVAALAAACEMRAWTWTGIGRHRTSALSRLRRIAAKVDEIREADFFTPFPLSFAYRIAGQADAVDSDLRMAIARFVALRFRPRDFTSLNNQTLIRACGLAMAAQVWPDLPEARGWRDYAATIASLLEKIEDVPENAPTYNAIDLACVWLLADLLQRPDLTAKPGVVEMFRRYRNQVSPAGFLPPYGDSGTAPRPFTPDWPMQSAWAHYVAAFERAGREYRDATLVWAAERIEAAGMRHMPLGSAYADVEPLFYSSFAAEWMDPDLRPERPAAGSQVLTRRDEARIAVPDKLLLAASRSSREAFLMADLYCRGAHGHPNQHGAVSYLEFRDTPLLTTLGYNNREPAHANLVMVAHAGMPFPLDPDGFTPGTWHVASLPTSRLPAHDASRPFHRRIDAVNFRITAGRHGVDFTAADLRLTGSGAAIVLDDLRSAAGWKGDPEAGDDGLAWKVPPGVHFLEKRGFAREFDCRDHPLVTFRWKLSNSDERARPIIVRVHCADRAVDYHAEVTQLDPALVTATAEERDGIQRSTLRFTGWFTPDTTLDREMALTRSGVLVVRDILRPGPMAEGRVAGPIWHLAATGSPKPGPHWFASDAARTELLIWFEDAPGRDFGGQTFDVWSKHGQQTVFAREPLHAGRPVRFMTVLVPHDHGTDAEALARGISIAEVDDFGQRVRIESTGDVIDF